MKHLLIIIISAFFSCKSKFIIPNRVKSDIENYQLNNEVSHGLLLEQINAFDIVLNRKNFSNKTQLIYPLCFVKNHIYIHDSNDQLIYECFIPNAYIVAFDTILPNEIHRDTFDVFNFLNSHANKG